jgi:hypothetical protein
MTEAPNWIIMPFIDCWDYTRAAVTDALEQKIEPSPRLLLIDNGSKYEVRLKAEEFDRTGPVGKAQNLRLWRHAPPLPSIAATWNRALDFVWEAGGEHALVVNNDVRLHRETHSMLLWAQAKTDALFITGVGVQEEEFDPGADYRALPMGPPPDDSLAWEFSKGGPDFSCFLISHACHERYRFDENFVPAYHEDNDYHRRMILGGDGDRIFSVNVPFLHFGSVTINRDEKTKAAWGEKFARCKAYYVKKWGGLPGAETFDTPFGEKVEEKAEEPPA